VKSRLLSPPDAAAPPSNDDDDVYDSESNERCCIGNDSDEGSSCTAVRLERSKNRPCTTNEERVEEA
jgi:hypothetical protein